MEMIDEEEEEEEGVEELERRVPAAARVDFSEEREVIDLDEDKEEPDESQEVAIPTNSQVREMLFAMTMHLEHLDNFTLCADGELAGELFESIRQMTRLLKGIKRSTKVVMTKRMRQADLNELWGRDKSGQSGS